MAGNLVSLEEGWGRLQREGIDVLEEYLATGKAYETAVPEDQAPAGATSNEQLKQKYHIFAAKQYSELYTLVYTMCTQRAPNNWSDELYKRHGNALQRYASQLLLPKVMDKSGFPLLRELCSAWELYKIYNSWMEKLFTYLNRYYVQLRPVEDLYTKGFQVFIHSVLLPVKTMVVEDFLQEVDHDRNGMDVDRTVLRAVRQLFVDLGCSATPFYVTHLEQAIIPATKAYYSNVAAKWLEELDFADYLLKVETVIEQEANRSKFIFHPCTKHKIQSVLTATLLEQPSKTLFAKPSGVTYLLEADKVDDLGRAYRLFSQIGDEVLKPLAQGFREYITSRGLELIRFYSQRMDEEIAAAQSQTRGSGLSMNAVLAQQQSDPRFVVALLELHQKYSDMVAQRFEGSLQFYRSLRCAFEEFVNRSISKHSAASLFSSYCDGLLRKGSGRRMEEAKFEEVIGKVVGLFSYLSDKDLFLEVYRNQLAKRLLNETYASLEAEQAFISKLKVKCGAQFTSRLEGMISDLNTAENFQKLYTDWKRKREGSTSAEGDTVDFQVRVLTTGYWPCYSSQEVALPLEMHRCIKSFTDFYDYQTSHRKLQWIHSIGTVVVGATLNGKRYDLSCNALQAAILMLFNGRDSLHFLDIKEETKLQDDLLLKKLLGSFFMGKFKVLLKTNNTKGVNTSDGFRVNDSFTSAHRKLRIPAPLQEESHSKERVEEDRGVAIEAAIVRIMKARKTLSHAALVSEVLAQLHFFKPIPRVIKTKIEGLIEREYLERSQTDLNQYSYVA